MGPMADGTGEQAGRVDLVQGPATRGGLPSADRHSRDEKQGEVKSLENRFFKNTKTSFTWAGGLVFCYP